MKKIVVTGGGGYIGSVLVRWLLENHYEVLAVDRFFFGRENLPADDGRFTALAADIRSLPADALKGAYAVIDLAALSNDPSGDLDPNHTWEINHKGRVRVARLAKEAGVPRYLFPSSCSIYGFQDGEVDESSPINPLTTYAKANRQAEIDILPLADSNFCATVLRQATVYGASPRMRFDLAINGMVKGFMKNKKIPILRDGTQWRPFVHVKDIARAMTAFLEAPVKKINGEIFNVGSSRQNIQILPLAKEVAGAMGVPFAYEWYGSADHRSYRVNFDKIKKTIGYETKFTPSDGAREVKDGIANQSLNPDDPRTITVEWYKHLIGEGVAV